MSKHDLSKWRGVFPAVTTQFEADGSINYDATQKVIDGLIKDGVHGLVFMGTVGENNSLRPEEKIQVLESAVEATAGRAFTITGVSDYDAPRASEYAQAAEKAGVDALMVLPAMVYMPTEAELDTHLRTVSNSTDLPVMIYNNPTSYRLNMSVEAIAGLMDVENIVAYKESAEDSRRFTDIYNAIGDRLVLFAGLDDLALEGLILGAKGWVSGLTNAFPRESVALFDLLERGEVAKALEIYRWFMPLLHLDAQADLVQCIKLAEQVMGRGSENVRAPRQVLTGETRAKVIKMVETARDTRPDLDALLA